MNALVKRHGAPAPPCDLDWLYVRPWIAELIRDAPWFTSPWTDDRDAWMARWAKSKRDAIRRSEDSDPVQPWRTKATLKRESKQVAWTKARIIQAYYNAATQSEHGPRMYSMQKSVFEWINRHCRGKIRITIASGLQPRKIARWMDRVHLRWRNPVFRERDGKNWDACMGEKAYALFAEICDAVDPEFGRFVRAGYAAQGIAFFSTGVFRYTLVGGTKSGFNQTTLFNSLINACIAYETCAHFGIEAEILVAGDDLLVASGESQSGHAEYEAHFGIVPESRIFDDYVDVTFISSCWLRGRDGFRFVPLLGRLLAKLGVTVNPPSPAKRADYWDAVVRGLGAAVGDLPLYCDFLVAGDGDHVLPKDYHMWVAQFGGVDADSWMESELMRKYHLSVSEFDSLRKYLRALPRTPVLFHHPLVEQVLDRDLADLMDRPLAGVVVQPARCMSCTRLVELLLVVASDD